MRIIPGAVKCIPETGLWMTTYGPSLMRGTGGMPVPVSMWTAAEPDLVESTTEVAVTVKLPVVEPAVYSPLVEMAPPVADQVTAVLELPVTAAVNCWVAPGCSVTLVGATVTL